MRDGRCSMDGSRGGKAISSDENALFSLQFYLINLHHLGVCVGGDKQDIVSAEKTDGVDGIDRANRADRVNRANRADGTNGGKVNGGGADGTDQVDRADKSGADVEELD